MEKVTSKTEIRRVLRENGRPMAVHEIKSGIYRYSENNLATRLSEMQRSGEVMGRRREGEKFNEWWLLEAQGA